ncbi:tyrosine-type recombinase/integrase (plasmid) [Streptomyces sp. HU2014]|uniref:tyrosine-type recombinase/integrase n=1 Tax=Streptomyces sp. HU2014 TaxID=2939414 RepID=UPI00200CC571|nr:tyrosine-type recombinase/integrase [Streptomyces sp. HU2014]UQI49741.1 tyrosine-type recombinase/integrase [Streptomyces sp. HU2014]
MTDHETGEVIEAELVTDGENLPAPQQQLAATARALVNQHTILRPGELVPTTADSPTYTRADFGISADTAARDARRGAANTRRNRSSAVAVFEAWCASRGRVAYPCTTATFTEYGNHLIRRGLKANSISTYMSLIRKAQPVGQQPDGSVFRDHLATYKRENPRKNRKKQSPPIRLPQVIAMIDTCDARHPIGIRDAALLSCGYGILARRVELADLLIEDITLTENAVLVYIAISKTDQDAEGVTVTIPDRPDLQPVRHMRAWLEMLRALGITRGAVFRALTVAGTLQSRTTATLRAEHLSGDAINEIVKRRAKTACLPDAAKLTAHGLRAGPTTDLAKAGVRGKRLNRAGRWADDSRIPETVYVRLAEEEEGAALSRVPLHRPFGNSPSHASDLGAGELT